jgi:DNA-binding NarL/FixJ family response regulator
MPQRLERRRSHKRSTDRSRALVLVNDDAHPGRGRHSDAISVLLASAGKLARAGLEALLDAQADMAVAGSAATEAEAVALAGQVRPDVLLIDVTPPGIDAPGIDAVQVTQRVVTDPDASAVHVLILGTSEHGEEIFSSLRAGAGGFLSRDIQPAELVHGVRTVAAGEAVLSSSGIRRVITELASRPNSRLPSPEQLDELTAREREVMALVAAGLSNEEIAEHLVVANATAKTHVSRAMGKLCARNRAQLVTLAYETGLVFAGHAAARQFGVPMTNAAAA